MAAALLHYRACMIFARAPYRVRSVLAVDSFELPCTQIAQENKNIVMEAFPAMSDITMLSMAEVASMLKDRKISPLEVLDACMKRTKSLNGELNAYNLLMEDEAFAAAKQAETDIAAGKYKGALHGIPIALKDLFYTKGIPTTAGSELMRDFRPTHNGTVVQRLIDAGAVITGKTNTHEWAFGSTTEESCFGPTRNPWNTKKIVGGSSGGSAVAAATGMAYVAMGSDTGGSVRIPAAMCGTVGFKPSYGAASLYGIIALSWNLDHPGPLTRSVEDAAIAMDHITGHDPLDPCAARSSDGPTRYAAGLNAAKDLKGRVIGVPENFFFDKTNYDVEKSIRAAIKNLKTLGAEIRYLTIPALDLVPDASTTILFSDAAFLHKECYSQHPDKFQRGVRLRLDQGGKYTAVQYLQALKERETVMTAWEQALADIDAVVAPTCPITAYDIGLPEPWDIQTRGRTEPGRSMCTQHTRLSCMTGSPALSVPCGFGDDGMPIGLMFMGSRNDDLNVLQIGHVYEQNFPYTLWGSR